LPQVLFAQGLAASLRQISLNEKNYDWKQLCGFMEVHVAAISAGIIQNYRATKELV